jgi:hypothetical protein
MSSHKASAIYFALGESTTLGKLDTVTLREKA